MSNPVPQNPNLNDEEIDITEIMERIDSLEKEIRTQKEEITRVNQAVADLDESFDYLVKNIQG